MVEVMEALRVSDLVAHLDSLSDVKMASMMVYLSVAWKVKLMVL